MRRLTVLSFGGGQDSTEILYKYAYDAAFRLEYAPEGFVVIMSDTKNEHPHTYAHVQEIKRFCILHGIEFHLLTSDMGFHVESWPDLITPQTRVEGGKFKPTLVQLGTKTCTLQLKIGPIYKFLDEWINTKYGYGFKVQPRRGCLKQAITRFGEENGHIDVLIGFAAGEESRMNRSLRQEAKDQLKPGFWKYIRRRFPLVDLGLDRAACQADIVKMGHKVPYPSNCMRCPYMSPEELLWLSIHQPKELKEWEAIEAAKLVRFEGVEKNHGVFNTKRSIRDRLELAEKKYAHLTHEELMNFLDNHKMNHGCGSGGH